VVGAQTERILFLLEIEGGLCVLCVLHSNFYFFNSYDVFMLFCFYGVVTKGGVRI
jgi:hypothetical protein